VEFYSQKPEALPPEVEWIENTVGDMRDVGNAEVDLIFSGQNLEHLWPDEVIGFLLEAHRTLKDYGWLVIDTPNRFVTAKLAWSHPEHTIEFTPSEAEELLHLAGFAEIRIRGVWLCYDSVAGALLPLSPLSSPARWPYQARIAAAVGNPEDSFVWWAEARKSPRQPDAVQLASRVREIYTLAWPERVQRFSTHIGTKSPDGTMISSPAGASGALMFGPYMPLRTGSYRVTFSLTADAAGLPTALPICTCDVYSTNRERIASHDVLAGDIIQGSALNITIPFDLSSLEFGMQFRIISFGVARIEAAYSVRLDERVN
jgi:hypothetical protein